ncbi:MAG: alpha/beta fold hydrolase [Gemmatimonadaceae bacterium]|nr:alpha/beta fold hydrolase [Gemmatimonadaceae bacterium]
MRGEFVDLSGERLYCFAAGTRGEGDPVLFVHGFPTSSHLWQPLLPILPGGFRSLVVDLLGYGRSDRPLDADYSITAHARRLHALLEELGVPRVTIVAHDFGALVAESLARAHPTRVGRLLLVSPPALRRWPTFAQRSAARTAPLWRALPSSVIASQLHVALLRGYFDREQGRHSLDAFLRPFASTGGARLLAAHTAVQRPGFTGPLTLPIALLGGRRDPWCTTADLEATAARLGGATIDRVDHARHFVPEEAPERLGRALVTLQLRDR